MKKLFRLLYVLPLSFVLTGCWTSIWTAAPTTERVVPVKTVYTTQVTTPAPKHTTTTTVTVTSFNNDWSFYLDLNAVAAAFAEARSVREFEQILNSSRYMINNLDLNNDGWIDYLRVIETHKGYYHTLLLQACLAPGVFQDVATLIAEHRVDRLYVEVVGDVFLYGYNYIVRPVFVKRPPMWDVYGHTSYVVWTSPYYYGYFPSYYTHPKPVYLSHYQAYVTTYMSNHHYCHHCDYPTQPFYSGYTQMTQPHHRNDYATQHPNESFDHRVTHTLSANGSGVTVRNAGQLRTETQRQAAPANTSSTSSTTTRQSSASTNKSTSATTTTRQSSSTTTRQSGTTTRQTTTTTPQAGTVVDTKVSKKGTTRTTIKTTDATGRTTTVKRESKPATTTRSSATTTTTTTTTRQSTTSSSGTTSTSTTRRR